MGGRRGDVRKRRENEGRGGGGSVYQPSLDVTSHVWHPWASTSHVPKCRRSSSHPTSAGPNLFLTDYGPTHATGWAMYGNPKSTGTTLLTGPWRKWARPPLISAFFGPPKTEIEPRKRSLLTMAPKLVSYLQMNRALYQSQVSHLVKMAVFAWAMNYSEQGWPVPLDAPGSAAVSTSRDTSDGRRPNGSLDSLLPETVDFGQQKPWARPSFWLEKVRALWLMMDLHGKNDLTQFAGEFWELMADDWSSWREWADPVHKRRSERCRWWLPFLNGKN